MVQIKHWMLGTLLTGFGIVGVVALLYYSYGQYVALRCQPVDRVTLPAVAMTETPVATISAEVTPTASPTATLRVKRPTLGPTASTE